MRRMREMFTLVTVVTFGVVLLAGTPSLAAQGKAYGRDREQKAQPQRGGARGDTMQERGRGRSEARGARRDTGAMDTARGGRGQGQTRGRGRYMRTLDTSDFRGNIGRMARSDKARERVVAGAVARAHARGVRDDGIVVTPSGNRISVRNKAGDTLVVLDDDKARDVGDWKVVPADDTEKEGQPSFCRSGEGHPVWGRQWCVDKGFGLGEARNGRWAKTDDPDIELKRPRGDTTKATADTTKMDRRRLIDLIGETVYNRIALHAITLGLDKPIMGTWVREAEGPRVLMLNAGGEPVAELVDQDRDDRVDRLLIALRGW